MKYIYGQRVTSFRKKLTSVIASVAILANSMGVALPIFLTQRAYAATEPEITHVSPALVDAHNYRGITVTIRTQNVTTAENVTVTVNRASGGEVVKTAKPSVIAAMNSTVGVFTTSAPIVINNISYNEAGSGSWNPPVPPIWNSSTVPQSVTVSITGSDGLNLTRTENVTGPGVYLNMLPTPVVAAENFNTHNGTDYRGVNVGFNANNFSNVSSAKVELYRGATLEATNTATPTLLSAINNTSVVNPSCNPGAGSSFGTPFVTVERTYIKTDDPCWTMTNYVVTNKNFKPTKAVITLTQDGVDYVATTSSNLSEATIEFQYVITMRALASTSELNKNTNMPYVELVASTNDTVELKFINPTNSYAYFEYKIDGETPATYPNGAPLKTPHSWLGAGVYEYPGAGLDNRFTPPTTETTKVFSANEKVEVRFALGNPGTAFFDWTPFYVTSDPDPTNSHQLTLSGVVFNNRNSDRDRDTGEEVLNNWTVRAYKENVSGDWELVGTTATRPSDNQYAIRQYEAGVYHVCVVNQTGWDQIRQDWDGTPYHTITDNLSGATDEGKWCSTVNYDDTADRSNAKYFGVIDTQRPTGNAVYHGGVVNSGTHYLRTIDDLSFTETINDNYGVVRGTYLVQKYNNSTEKFEGFCGNWNANSSGSHALGGSTNEVHTVTNIKNCVADSSAWTDGTYKIFHAAYDSAGNEGKFNVDRHIFVLDSTAPDTPTDLHRVAKDDGEVMACSITTQRQVLFPTWEANAEDDFSHYEYTSYNSGNVIGVNEQELSTNQFTHNWTPPTDGTNGFKVRTVDYAGNKSDWTDVCYVTYDSTAPAVPTGLTYKTTSDKVLSSGDTTNELTGLFDWDDVSEAVLYNLYVWHDTVGSPLYSIDGPGTFATGVVDSEVGGDLSVLGESTQSICLTAVDAAGNESACSAPFSLTLDLTPPNVTINPLSASTNTTPVITGTVDDPAATVKVSVDGGTPSDAVNNGDGTWTFTVPTPLTVGAHTFVASATDTTGNATNPEPSTTYTITIASQGVAGVSTDTPNSNASGNSGGNPSPTAFRNAAARGNTSGNGSVLAAETDDPSSEDLSRDEAQSEVDEARTLAAGDENSESTDNSTAGCGKFMGICWYWWIPIVIAILGTIYYLTSRRADEK